MTQEAVFLTFVVMTIGAIVVTIIYCKWWDKDERTKEEKKWNNGTVLFYQKIVKENRQFFLFF